MKKTIIIIAMFVLGVSLCPAVTGDDGAGLESEFEQKVSEQIDKSAKQTLAMLEEATAKAGIKTPAEDMVERTTYHDYCYASNIDEYNKLNTYGIIMIAAQTHDPKELPPKRAYLKSGKNIIKLYPVYSKQIKVSGGLSEKLFGKHRMYIYYLLPYAATAMEGKIYLDWGANRDEYSVCGLPLNSNVDYDIGKSNILPDKSRKVDAVALAVFLMREYSFTKEEALAAVKRPGK